MNCSNAWQRFVHVTLPQLSPTIFFTMVMGVIASFQVFTQVFVMTQFGDQQRAGPANSLLFYVLYLYNKAFQYFRTGQACAMAWILFAIIMVFTVVQLKLAKRWVYYEGET